MASFLGVPLSFTVLLFAVAVAVAQPVYKNCSSDSFTPGSAFGTSLNALLGSLSSAAASSHFKNVTAGTDGPSPAYGLYLCEGDLSANDCQACIAKASADVLTQCPSRRRALLWYDYCTLRYSDRNFFGDINGAGIALFNPNNVSVPSVPINFVSDLVAKAPLHRPLMFASNFSAQQQLFGMAECTMDISSQNCTKCLSEGLEFIKTCCSSHRGWRYLAPSCSLRYESTQFLNNVSNTGGNSMVPTRAPAPAPGSQGVIVPPPSGMAGNTGGNSIIPTRATEPAPGSQGVVVTPPAGTPGSGSAGVGRSAKLGMVLLMAACSFFVLI